MVRKQSNMQRKSQPTYAELKAENAALKRQLEIEMIERQSYSPVADNMKNALNAVMKQRDDIQDQLDTAIDELEKLQSVVDAFLHSNWEAPTAEGVTAVGVTIYVREQQKDTGYVMNVPVKQLRAFLGTPEDAAAFYVKHMPYAALQFPLMGVDDYGHFFENHLKPYGVTEYGVQAVLYKLSRYRILRDDDSYVSERQAQFDILWDVLWNHEDFAVKGITDRNTLKTKFNTWLEKTFQAAEKRLEIDSESNMLAG